MSQRLLRLTEDFDKILARLDRQATRRIATALDASYKQLEGEIKRRWTTLLSPDPLISDRRRLLIQQQLGILLDLVSPEFDWQTLLFETYQQASAIGLNLAQDVLDELAIELIPQTQIPIEAIASVADDSFDRLKRHGQTFANETTETLILGLSQGWGIRRIQKALRSRLGVAKGRAEAIARTETNRAFNNAATQRYIDAGMTGFIWIITKDDRLCPYCAPRGGRAYPLGAQSPPLHPNCRCSQLPWSQALIDSGAIDVDVLKRDREFVLKEFEKVTGKKPTNRPGPFERGLLTAPQSIWEPA
ncbi:MAG: minor capsid protein [Cyanobacteria bacterium J06648_11]